MYSKEIHIPMCPTKEELKKMRKSTLGVVDGGKTAKQQPASGKTDPTGKKN